VKIINVEQLSMGWFQAHCGVVSASYMKNVLDFTQKGAPGASRKTYLRTKVAELLTGVVLQDNFVSQEMLDGIERESDARAAYEVENGVMVELIGFALHDDINRFGCSPDGLVVEDGMVQIKCPKAGTHVQWILDGVVPEEHIPQMNAELAVTGRTWSDFVSFHPHVPKALRLMTIRHEPKPEELRATEAAAVAFLKEIYEIVDRLRAIVGPFDLPAAVSKEERKSNPDDELGYLTADDFSYLD
jgi:YqaJ-like viral recombinase domain